MITKEGKRR